MINKNLEQINPNQESKNKPLKDPRNIIMGIIQEVYMLGANDSELPALNAILKQLEGFSPEEIIEKGKKMVIKAQKILKSKQSYH